MKTLLFIAISLSISTMTAAVHRAHTVGGLATNCEPSWSIQTRCQESLDLDAYLAAVAKVESSGRTNAVGDGGRAVGLFQFHRGTWDTITRIRRAEGQAVAPYSMATHPVWQTRYMVTLTLWNRTRFQAATNRQPSVCDLYAMHNLGFDGYKRRGFVLQRCPMVTRKAASRVKVFTVGNNQTKA